jgi:uncharacterized protein YndB with AHSA1/START domain
MIDVLRELAEVHRSTGHATLPGGPARTVVLRRAYPAPIDDVWDAVTDPDRIARWFLPVSGDLRLGGTYQLKGNAGGEIRECQPPTLLRVTWVFVPEPTPADVTEVTVRLSAQDDGTTAFELEHTAVTDTERWPTYGPGAVGVGWDLTLLGLGLHLGGGEGIGDPEEWERSDEAREFITASSTAWGEALRASGATADEVTTAVTNTTAFYAPPPANG